MKSSSHPKIKKSFGRIVHHLRLLPIAFLSFLHLSSTASAIEFEAGVGALEEGDDRGRSAAILHMGLGSNWMSRAYVWGRNYGPVSETSGVLTFARRGSVFGSKSLSAAVGGSVMAEQTTISFKDHPEDNSSQTSTNLGLMLGLRYEIFAAKQFSVAASWDSHIFPAGSAFVLMVTGRKQVLGLTAGLKL